MAKLDIESRIKESRPGAEAPRPWFQANLRQQLVEAHGKMQAPRATKSRAPWFIGFGLVLAGSALALFVAVERPAPSGSTIAELPPVQTVDSLGDASQYTIPVGERGGLDDGTTPVRPTYVLPAELPAVPATGFVFQLSLPVSDAAAATFPTTAPAGFTVATDAANGAWDADRGDDFVSPVPEVGAITLDQVPSNDKIIAAANAAAKTFGVDNALKSFGTPTVTIENAGDPVDPAQADYLAFVSYPFLFDGAPAYQVFGSATFGAWIIIRLQSMQVVSMHFPIIESVRRAAYPLEADQTTILTKLNAATDGTVVASADAPADATPLGAPELVLVDTVLPADGRTTDAPIDLYEPAWRFPVLGDPTKRQQDFLYVPLVGTK